MVDIIKNPESTTPLEQYSQSPGFTSADLTSTQVSSLNTKHDSSEKSFKDGAGNVIGHKFGHQLGLSDTSQE